jgi:hypothetical protein
MDALLSPGSCLAITLMFAVAVLFRSEFSRHKAAALPYLACYWIAGTFYAMFFVFALDIPGFGGKLERCLGYLCFTTGVLLTGMLVHWRSVRKYALKRGEIA